MGLIWHQAVIVTSYSASGWDDLAIWCEHHLPHAVGRIAFLPVAINGTRVAFLGPDGGKEGWESSEQGDADRAAFKDAAEELLDCPHIVEVSWGDNLPTVSEEHGEWGP